MEGKVFIYKLIDVCDEIDISKLKGQLRKLKESPLQARSFTPAYMRFEDPPLEMRGGTFQLDKDGPVVNIKIKFYSLGIVSIRYEVPILAEDLPSLFEKAFNIVNLPDFEKKMTAVIERSRDILEKELGIKTRVNSDAIEDYGILWIQKGYEQSDPLLKPLIARFLRNEKLPLSKYEESEACRYQFSYTPEDLTIIDWDRAVTIDTAAQEDVWNVIEYVNLQLVELRYYEDALDKELDGFYKFIKKPRWRAMIEFYKTGQILRELSILYFDFDEIRKKLSGFVRLSGDEYLSRIYAAAAKRMNLDSFWSDLRERLLETRRLYEMISSHSSAVRMEILEATIVILIILEIILSY